MQTNQKSASTKQLNTTQPKTNQTSKTPNKYKHQLNGKICLPAIIKSQNKPKNHHKTTKQPTEQSKHKPSKHKSKTNTSLYTQLNHTYQTQQIKKYTHHIKAT